MPRRTFAPYAEAARIVREARIQTAQQFKDWTERPSFVPAAPDMIYKHHGWTTWGDFLATGNVARGTEEWVSYDEAVRLVRQLGIKDIGTFYEKRPKNVPSYPHVYYKDNGWASYPDFWGEGRRPPVRHEQITFDEAKEIARQAGIKSAPQFQEWRHGRPTNMPSNPETFFVEWVSWPDFFGTEIEWMSYDEAKEWVQHHNIRSKTAFDQWTKNPLFPDNLPKSPGEFYKDTGWISWGDFLGTGRKISTVYRPYDEAAALVRSLDIKTAQEFFDWSKAGERPTDIPSRPYLDYRRRGWVSWPMFCGTEKQDVVPHEEAMILTRSKGIQSRTEYRVWAGQADFPPNLPPNPDYNYAKRGWTSWSSFLGTPMQQGRPTPTTFLSYADASKVVSARGLKSSGEYRAWTKLDHFPEYLPKNAPQAYRDSSFSWGDYLGSGYIAHTQREYLSYLAAKAFVAGMQMTRAEWDDYVKTVDFPSFLPKDPYGHYRERGWRSWNDFMGTEHQSTLNRKKYIEMARRQHGPIYGYEALPSPIYTSSSVTLTCNEHGPFSIDSHDHLAGAGCPVCDGSLGLT